jgi:hypothetical protein
MTITAQMEDGRLLLSLPAGTLDADEAVRLLQDLAGLRPDQRQYLDQVASAMRQQEAGALAFAEADRFALAEAARLGLPLTARQRSTLIQYYVDRAPASDPVPGGGAEAARNRAIALARALRNKT